MRAWKRPLAGQLRQIAYSARVYDAAQLLLGAPLTRRRLRRHVAGVGCGRVLDVGGGTGSLRPLVPDADYVYVDVDPAKLEAFRRRFPHDRAVLADATALPFDDRSFDVTACIAVAHHLDDAALGALVDEAARVTRHQLLFLDPVEATSPLARVLWRLDRGAFPRSAERLLDEIGRRFEIDTVERHRLAHSYLLCVASTRHEERTSGG